MIAEIMNVMNDNLKDTAIGQKTLKDLGNSKLQASIEANEGYCHPI